jgi:ABC-type Mn2+/Zn2+ transport system ATPase subunit/predicted XRE-type DNA-binding protein
MAKTLETDIKEFIAAQPYWSQYLCCELLKGTLISEPVVEAAFQYLLEDLKLLESTQKPQLSTGNLTNSPTEHKDNLILSSLSNVEGVNALKEKQCLEFCPNLTIVFGANGAGKSGYIRLLKNVFYSKDREKILENINLKSGHKTVSADFLFISDNNPIPLRIPDDTNNGIFNQFAVFDSKIAKMHLCNRNDFSFRPAGLRLFNEYNTSLEKLFTRLQKEIDTKNIINVFAEDDIFPGESEIKTFLSSLSSKSKLDNLKKHLPFTEEDKLNKYETEKKYDDLKISIAQKDKAIKDLKNIKQLLEAKRKILKNLNLWINQIQLNEVNSSITDYLTKAEISKTEGIENFKTDKIKNIGSPEWKKFIEAAESFANTQGEENTYPQFGDYCLLCHQPITDEKTRNLVLSYWKYIKSIAEQEAKTSLDNLNRIKKGYEQLNIENLFPESDTLTVWLKENHANTLNNYLQVLTIQKKIANEVISSIETKKNFTISSEQLDLKLIDSIDTSIDSQIKSFEEDTQIKALAELLKQKTYLAHKEKLQARFKDVKKLHENMVWVSKANLFNKQSFKSQSTSTEKKFSKQYFNADYIKSFNNECELLNGKFGIDIDARSSDAKSNRQLFLKGKDPSLVLSEGEQKVIALADFIAETNITGINRGIIFDDPVNSLDEERKYEIAKRLASIAKDKQVVVFTHDLVFVSNLINFVSDLSINHDCHWIESTENEIGIVWLKNTPSYEKSYKKSGKAQDYYEKANKAQPEDKEVFIKNGFTALRTSYEALVIFELFEGVVQRFNERVSVDSLSNVYFDESIKDEILDSFYQCCRFMEGHLHSDKYAYKKPTTEDLKNEINRFNNVKKKLKDLKKAKIAS